jgi:hypothetical protein
VQQIGVDRERRFAALVLGDRNLVRSANSMSFVRLVRSHSRHGAITLMSGFSA